MSEPRVQSQAPIPPRQSEPRLPLDAIIEPNAVAVIGVTEKTGSVGRSVPWDLISSPFGRTVYPVNPKRPNVLGVVTPWTAIDGIRLVLRPIRPEDEPLRIAFHGTPSERSVSLRYFHAMTLSTSEIHSTWTELIGPCDDESAFRGNKAEISEHLHRPADRLWQDSSRVDPAYKRPSRRARLFPLFRGHLVNLPVGIGGIALTSG